MREPTVHFLKTWPKYFLQVSLGLKPYEIRSTKDREFVRGDILVLVETAEDGREKGKKLVVKVTHIVDADENPELAERGLILPDVAYMTIERIKGSWEVPEQKPKRSDFCIPLMPYCRITQE